MSRVTKLAHTGAHKCQGQAYFAFFFSHSRGWLRISLGSALMVQVGCMQNKYHYTISPAPYWQSFTWLGPVVIKSYLLIQYNSSLSMTISLNLMSRFLFDLQQNFRISSFHLKLHRISPCICHIRNPFICPWIFGVFLCLGSRAKHCTVELIRDAVRLVVQMRGSMAKTKFIFHPRIKEWGRIVLGKQVLFWKCWVHEDAHCLSLWEFPWGSWMSKGRGF